MAGPWEAFGGTSEPSGMTQDGRPAITVNPIRPDYSNALSSIESGGNYRAVGPQTGKGRALGKYQVMEFNVGPWTEEVLGQKLTPMQFLADDKAQDAVFQGKFGQYVEKHGPEGAARAWFAGEKGMNDPNRRDVLGTTVANYGRKFTNALSGPGVAVAQTAPQMPRQPQAGPWEAFKQPAAPEQPAGPVEQRFGQMQEPANAPALRAGLNQRGLEMNRGPEQPPAAQMATDFANAVPAASQRTSPHVDAYGGQLVSTETFEDDGGNILYRDPQTGEVRPTDQSTQVAIRDPRDGVVKVFNRSDATNESAFTGAARVATGGMMAGAPTVRAALPASNKVLPKASDIISTAKPHYRAFDAAASKIEIPADTARGIVDRIKGAMEATVPEHLAEEVYKSVEKISKGVGPKELPFWNRVEAEMNGLSTSTAGKSIAVDHLRDVKELIGQSSKSADARIRQAAAIATKEINKIIGEVSPEAAKSLKTADEIYSAGKSLQELQRKGDVAGLRAGRAGYGGNAVNTMRQTLSPIVQRAIEGKVTGFKPNEIQAMREIVEGKPGVNAARLVGQLSPTSGLGVIRAAGAGGTAIAAGASGGMALAIPAIGAASNKLATVMTGKQLDKLNALVAKRSPAYAEAVAKAVERFEKAQMELIKGPAPNKLAAYVSASRALSAGLTRDGIQITSGQLLKTIEGPMKGAADSDEPAIPGSPSE
jgi:hypothetical protein